MTRHDQTRHMTYDTQCVMNIISKFQLPSPYGLGLRVFGRYFDYRVTKVMNESMNDRGDCRTAPATPGLLKR